MNHVLFLHGYGLFGASDPLHQHWHSFNSNSEGRGDLDQIDGSSIHNNCEGGLTNWNSWKFTEATGAKGFKELCEFNCKCVYCPVSSCLCQAVSKPKALEAGEFLAEGRSENYFGLCSWACNHGYCQSEYCSPTQHPTIVPKVSDLLPPACTAGKGDGALGGLCSYACDYGFCPCLTCTCNDKWGLHQPPTAGNPSVSALSVAKDHGLCDFACSRG
ncbi:hypothetical protein CGMCC3_g9926 [Colletotrichum fructicola]|nr:uncharacterized protein CGMCC3_g9926 [Colletotrichum fructicola]KAE9574012.1 hypothetical protein CGMCC3_g9926 [Colletotrichum fructicola]